MRRQILGKIYETDDTPFKNGVIVFSRSIGSYTSTTQYPPDVHVCRTDTSGNLVDCFLWCNEDGDLISNYTAKINGKDVFTLSLPLGDGSPIQLSVLRAGSQPTQSYPQTIIDYIDTKVVGAIASPTSLNTFTMAATRNISALKIIRLDNQEYASPLVGADALAGVCFVKTAANSGETFTGLLSGVVSDSFWNWDVNKALFLGVDGTVTQSVSTDWEFIKVVGSVVSPQQIFINFEESFSLE
jgi:hypothetical protein